MRFDELFEKRKLTGTKLKDYIRSNGFSKVSFCKKTEISRPTLDKILNGEIDSKSTFDKHLNKILTSLSIDPDTLMGFSPRIQSADAVFSENAPIDYQVNDKAKMEYHDGVDSLTIYTQDTDKILPEAAYSHFHPEREPDETHHAGISDSRCIQICF